MEFRCLHAGRQSKLTQDHNGLLTGQSEFHTASRVRRGSTDAWWTRSDERGQSASRDHDRRPAVTRSRRPPGTVRVTRINHSHVTCLPCSRFLPTSSQALLSTRLSSPVNSCELTEKHSSLRHNSKTCITAGTQVILFLHHFKYMRNERETRTCSRGVNEGNIPQQI